MRTRFFKMAFLIGLSLIISCIILQAKTYATIDGKAVVTDKDFEMFKQANPNFDYNKLSDQEKEMIINEFVMKELILKAAKQDKIDSSKEYTQALNAIKDQMLVELWQKKQADSVQVPNMTDAQLREIYKNNEGMFIDQEGKARHILVKTEDEAKNIIKELNSAKKVEAKFIELANAKSIDPGNQQAKNGGDLGVFQRRMMHPDFSKAAFDLKPGNYTKEPVQTSYGYHIIYLERKSEPKLIPYEQAKKSIEENIKMQNIQATIGQKIEDLRKKADIKITK